jgi:L-iditol 2-dehydrogenase
VVKAFSRGAFAAGQTALVVGLGSAGQLAVRLALERGAAKVVGADRVASRLALAARSGAQDLVDVSKEDLGEGAQRASDGRGYDFVFVGPGKPEVIASAASAVAAGGTLLLFTMAAPGETLALSPHDLYFREVSLVPSYSCGPNDTREALELIGSRRIAVEDLVTHRFPIGRADEAFARARQPEGSLKVLLTA